MPAEWTESDTIDWLFNVAGKLGIPCEYFASSNPIRGMDHSIELHVQAIHINLNNICFVLFVSKWICRITFVGNE